MGEDTMFKRTVAFFGGFRGQLMRCLVLLLTLALGLSAFAQKGVVHLKV
jgi:hypothetical protein